MDAPTLIFHTCTIDNLIPTSIIRRLSSYPFQLISFAYFLRLHASSFNTLFPSKNPVCAAPQPQPALDRFPDLDGSNINPDTAEAHAPLPRHNAMLEHIPADDRKIHDGEHKEEASGDSPEEEAVAPDGREDGQTTRGRGVRIQVEQRARKVLYLPGCDEKQERNGRIRSRSRAENGSACLVPARVAPTS